MILERLVYLNNPEPLRGRERFGATTPGFDQYILGHSSHGSVREKKTRVGLRV